MRNKRAEKHPRQTFGIAILIAVFALFSVVFSACNDDNSRTNFVALVDTTRAYTERPLTLEQRHIYQHCEIAHFFQSDSSKVFVVEAKRGYVDAVQMVVLVDGSVVKKIVGVDIKESEGYGAKCFHEKYLSQFLGIDLSTVTSLVGKDQPYAEGDIVFVTGATTTSKAVIDGINCIAAFLRDFATHSTITI